LRYPKSVKENLTAEEKRIMRRLVKQIIEQYLSG